MTINYTHPRSEMLGFLPAGAKSVLDVGCSSGSFGQELRNLPDEIRLIGVEPNPEAAYITSAVYDEVVTGRFPEACTALPSGQQYDAIYFNDVLEHIAQPEIALAAAKKLLVPEGVVIASIPNIRHVSVLGPLIVRGEFRYRESGILDTTHLRFFTSRSIRRLFELEHWKIEQLRGINRVMRIAETRNRPWIGALGRLSHGWTNDFFFVQYVVVARPR